MLIGEAAVLRPRAAFAQSHPKKIPVVGVLWHAANAEEESVFLDVVVKAFEDLGYVEGKTIILEHRYPAENPVRFRTLAQELVEAKPDVIIAVTLIGAIELKRLTNTIPIVLVLGSSDPVAAGLVESLARPGGNVTGLSVLQIDMSGKRLALLKEAVPHLSRIVFLVDPTIAFKEDILKVNQASAEALGVSLWLEEITGPNDIEPVFSKIVADGANGLVWGPGGLLFVQRARLGAAALAHRLPAMVAVSEEVPSGLLMSYGPDTSDFFRRAVDYTDKIIRGAKPADLPVEQPSKFKFVVNLKTAKALGLAIPQELLATADEVIE